MNTHETRRTLIRRWMAPPTDKRATEERMQRIVNALFFGLTIFSVAFAYFVLSAKAQDHHLHGTRNSRSFLSASGACPTTRSCCNKTDCYRSAHFHSDL
jgi:hypothetical protein